MNFIEWKSSKSKNWIQAQRYNHVRY